MKDNTVVPDEIISSKIYYIRGHKIMLDKDLAELYEVETKQLKRQVRRNIKRFPEMILCLNSPLMNIKFQGANLAP